MQDDLFKFYLTSDMAGKTENDDFVKLIGLKYVPEQLKVRAMRSSKPFGS